MTLFALRTADDLLTVRFAVSPVWETQAAVQALAAVTGLSPAGASRHLLALRDAGLVSAARHGHEVRYRRTELGSALLHGRQENDRSAGRRPRR
jgi:DNA-binding transcriptional ArsR family regulator